MDRGAEAAAKRVRAAITVRTGKHPRPKLSQAQAHRAGWP
jgi:hypothetical protein